jgi:hypothetical protein
MTRGSLSRGCGGPFSTAEWIKMRHGTKHALALPRGVEKSDACGGRAPQNEILLYSVVAAFVTGIIVLVAATLIS